MNHHDHGAHQSQGGMDMGSKCAMNMLWNTQIIDTCIVFPQWHVTSNTTFVLSCLVIVGLGVAYEWLRNFQRHVDVRIARSLRIGMNNEVAVSEAGASRPPREEDSLLTDRAKGRKIVSVPQFARICRAVLYGAAVFFSFFLMLIFMTYNAYLILAVVVGAAFGHFLFNGHMDPNGILSGREDGKGMACH